MADTPARPEPTPEQRFRRSVYIATAIGVLLLLYAVVADQFMPVTPESRVLYDITRIAPEVPGTVVRVNVANGQAVKAGDVLFVRAGAEHRFYDFTPDFETWVIFWGPKGGEA